MRAWIWVLLGVLSAGAAPGLAQQSSNFQLDEHVFNAGGVPGEDAGVVASTSFRMDSISIGEGVEQSELSSSSFGMSAGFLSAYPPPGEVRALRFVDATTLRWDGARAAGTYNLYRDVVSALTGLGFGQCLEEGIATNEVSDTENAPSGDGFFYLVTVTNRRGEEGPKGSQSGGSARQGNACP